MSEQTDDPLFDVDKVRVFLEERGLGDGPVRAERIGEGQSNVTFRVRQGDGDFVLRRGPRPPFPPSTHDMLREARLLEKLGPYDLPTPEILAICDDLDVLGVPFYLMAYVEGEILTDTEPEGWQNVESRRRVSEQLIDSLVELHSLPVDEGPLATIGKPAGYLARQVARFGALWSANTTRDVPAVAAIGAWLADRIPEQQRASIVHGDYRLGNAMFSPNAAGKPEFALLLDWEMATLGDPLADLGYLMATAAEPGAPGSVMQLSTVTALPGYLTRSEMAERYAAATGSDLTPITWYEVLALWKAAIFCEAIYTRWLAGERPQDTSFAPLLEQGVLDLIDQASERTGQEWKVRQ